MSAYDLDALASATNLADWMFEQVAPWVTDDVVEVGPGVGTFTQRLLAAGARELLLVESDPALAGVLAGRFAHDGRVRLVREDLPAAPTLAAHAGRAGLVLCQNVLEHVPEDVAAVAAMARALRPGGRLLVLVPAHPRLFGSLDLEFGHERRYTRGRLRAVLEQAGLTVEDLYSFNLLGVAGWWLKSRLGARTLGSGSLGVYERLVVPWRALERRRRPPAGLSLIARAVAGETGRAAPSP